MSTQKNIKTIKVAGKTYATGLFWQPLQNQTDYLNEVRATIQNVVSSANLFCFRKGANAQYGLGYTSMGHKSGMPSAASAIANVLRDKPSALCAFKVDNGWWFTAIRNNLILSEEDTVYTEEADAKTAFESMLDIPDWGYLIAPKEWGYENTTELQLSDLIVKGQSVPLKKIQDPIKIKDFVILIIVALVGYKYYTNQQNKKLELAKQLEERRRQEEIKKQSKPKELPPPPPAPYETLVDIEDMSKKCTILLVNSTAIIPGWVLENSNCIEKQVSSVWKRTYGSAGWIFEAQRLGIINKDIKLSANDISYNNVQGILNIPIMKHVSKKPVLTKVELQKKINGIFHALKNTSLNLTDNSITVKDPNNTSYIREYPYTEFKFKDFVYNLPIDWVNRLKEFEAVSFDSIVWDNSSRTWSYSGKIFEISPSQIKEEQEKLKLEKKLDKQNETDNLLENSSNITNTKE